MDDEGGKEGGFGRRKSCGHCFVRDFFDHPAGQEHADVVQHGVQVESKDTDVQVRVGVKQFSMTTQHYHQPNIDVQCGRGKDGKTGPHDPHERQPHQH